MTSTERGNPSSVCALSGWCLCGGEGVIARVCAFGCVRSCGRGWVRVSVRECM